MSIVCTLRCAGLAGLLLGATLAFGQPSQPAQTPPETQADVAPSAGDSAPADAAATQPASAPADKRIPLRDTQTPTPLNLNTTTSGPWGQLLAAVAVVGVLGLAAFLASRKLLPRLGVLPARSRSMSIVEVLHLGQRKRLCVVRVEGRRLLIGDAPAGLTMIADLGPDQRDDADGSAPQPAAASATGFAKVLAGSEARQ